jgi:hypothetical protein
VPNGWRYPLPWTGGTRPRRFDGIGHHPGIRLLRELLGAGVAGAGLSVVYSYFARRRLSQ